MRISAWSSDVCSSDLALLRGWLAFLCVRPLVGLGRISYPLYLIHQHIGFVIMFKADAAGISPNIGFAAAVASVLLLAALINRYVEGPANRWIRAWWKGRSLRSEEHTSELQSLRRISYA